MKFTGAKPSKVRALDHYGYPLREGSAVALRAVRDGLAAALHLERATFVLYSDDTYSAFATALAELAGR